MKFLRPILLAASVALIADARASVTIAWVTVGDAGNPADPTTGYGAVPYAYQIGKYEVTNAQYVEFLNAVDPGGFNIHRLYNTAMGSDVRGGIAYTAGAATGSKYTVRTNMGDKPVNWVSWYDAARFTNWLGNGQAEGNTETGAYMLNGNTGLDGMIARNNAATVYMPSEDEWYKAAFYDPTEGAGGGDNYWTYATQSDTTPTEAAADITGNIFNPGRNVANYNFGADWNDTDGNVTTVGSAGTESESFFGTADQAGNVFELYDVAQVDYTSGLRGGAWNSSASFGSFFLSASVQDFFPADGEIYSVGFRVASVPVPEPSSFFPAMLICIGVMMRRKR